MTRDILGPSRPQVSLAWLTHLWSSLPDLVRLAVLVTAAIGTGLMAWIGEPRLLPMAMLFPAFWALAPTRIGAAFVAAGYFLAASRGLPQGVMNFYGSGFGAGIGLWLAASLAFVFVHAALWTSRPGWRRAARYGVAALLMSVPPFGIVGWAHPITAAGVIFPGWGWLGLAAAVIGLLAMTTRRWPIAVLTVGGLWTWSAATWIPPNLPEGWVAVDTSFRGAEGYYADFDQQQETIELVLAAAGGAEVVVLPEGAIGMWTPTVERLWMSALRDLDIVVNAGAIVVGPDGYDNVMLELTASGGQVIYRERMPVPVSMWQPWRSWWGDNSTARAYIFSNPVANLGGRTILPLICYEQLIIWPVIQSMLWGSEAIVAVGNGWWTEGTSIVEIQRASTEAWALLFDLPLTLAFNE